MTQRQLVHELLTVTFDMGSTHGAGDKTDKTKLRRRNSLQNEVIRRLESPIEKKPVLHRP
ncbi:MAG TPA: hypothetical protein VJK09_00355 [Candidatus Paceibacterota bacterium]